MIPIRVDDETRHQMVRNILLVWDSATENQERQGREWYPAAHRLADTMADGDVKVGAGLLAAFSPQTAWTLNIELARDAYKTGSPRGHTGDALSKANKILAGMEPEDVLPMSKKTGQFFRCILDPTDPEAVCVDRHAHDVAVGEAYGYKPRGLSAKGRYALIAHCYREAAMRLGELPQTVQAVTWVVWRERLASIQEV